MKNALIKLVGFSSIMFLAYICAAANNIPYGNGTWVYDGTYNNTGAKGPVKAGLFKSAINNYNSNIATSKENQINEVFVYGGDLEGPPTQASLNDPNWSSVYYFPAQNIKQNKSWSDLLTRFAKCGDSGFTSSQSYTPKNQYLYGPSNSPLVTDNTGINGVNYKILVLDGRIDSGGYLQGLNAMSQKQAEGFAKKVAQTICADQSIDGIQFDVEPFSFTGKGGVLQGTGQMYFYRELAKDLAGWYNKSFENVNGINKYSSYDSASDPIHAVSAKHPYGRFFSVFTFSKSVTPNVISLYKKFGNFYIIDSLYDIGNAPAAKTATTIDDFKSMIKTEIADMKSKGIPYQFAIPAAASCHEFESCNGKNSNIKQIEYVKAAIEAINPGYLKKEDQNFKGIAIWSWNSAMWWNGNLLTPAKPTKDGLSYLGKNIGTYINDSEKETL